jgi:hypothetical protein
LHRCFKEKADPTNEKDLVKVVGMYTETEELEAASK